MLSSFLGRGLILAFTFVAQFSHAQRRIDFPRLDGEGSERAILVPIDAEGLYVTIGVLAADVTKGKCQSVEFQLIAQDSRSRITILKGPKSSESPVELAAGRNLKPGDQLRRTGKSQKAIVVSWENHFHEELLPLSFLRVHHQGTLPAPGWPLKNSDGKVVALCHQATNAFGHGTYAIPAEAVQRVIAGFKKHGKIRRSFCGINLDARDPVVSIIGVRPDSPAATVGIEKGDIILSVGGQPVATYADAVDAFFYLVPDVPIDFLILRGLDIKTIKVTPVVHPRYAAADAVKPEPKPEPATKE